MALTAVLQSLASFTYSTTTILSSVGQGAKSFTPHSCGGGKQTTISCIIFAVGVARFLRYCTREANAMAFYTTDEVARLFEDGGDALDSICMDGSEDELGMEDIELVQNPYYHHTPEFEDFEVIEGIIAT